MDSKFTPKVLTLATTYAMSCSFKRTAMRFVPVMRIDDPNRLLRGEHSERRPIEFRWDSGGKPQDLMGATYVSILLVSDRFTDALLDARVTGWGTYPVRLYDKTGLELPGYSGLAITGRAGPREQGRSKVERMPPPVPGGQAAYVEVGFYFNPESWDGSDMFIPQDTSIVCAVERVKKVLESRKLSNILFQPLDRWEGDILSDLPE